MEAEIWKDVEGFEELYQVSNIGRVKSLSRFVKNGNGGAFWTKERILHPSKVTGYPSVSLHDGQRKSKQLVHRLVARAFIPNPDNLAIVNHKDFNKENNNVSNLEWCTSQHNNKHAYDGGVLGLAYDNWKKKHGNAPHFNNVKIIQIGIDGIDIKEFESVTSAAKAVNGSTALICRVLKSKRTAYGYYWKYA